VTGNKPGDQRDSLTWRKRWAYRLAFGSLGVFLVLGAYLLYNPSDGLADAYGVMLLVTLVLGVLSGLVAVYSS
jgi:hypothetical protein